MFWLMCTVTTGIGVFLGLFFSQRTWCSFCPIGTLGCSFAKDRQALTIKRDICVGCKLCEKKCPMNIKILEASKNGTLVAPDCLKCGECIAVCPKKALSFARN
jgi:polyferredoxin